MDINKSSSEKLRFFGYLAHSYESYNHISPVAEVKNLSHFPLVSNIFVETIKKFMY